VADGGDRLALLDNVANKLDDLLVAAQEVGREAARNDQGVEVIGGDILGRLVALGGLPFPDIAARRAPRRGLV
jgi:hypothetical protein